MVIARIKGVSDEVLKALDLAMLTYSAGGEITEEKLKALEICLKLEEWPQLYELLVKHGYKLHPSLMLKVGEKQLFDHTECANCVTGWRVPIAGKLEFPHVPEAAKQALQILEKQSNKSFGQCEMGLVKITYWVGEDNDEVKLILPCKKYLGKVSSLLKGGWGGVRL